MDTYGFDKLMQLSDGAAPYTSNGIAQVGAANQILNLGAILSRTDLGIVGTLAHIRIPVIIDISAMVITTADDIYNIDMMASNLATGANPVHIGGLKVGYGTLIPNGSHSTGGAPAGTGSDSYPGRYIIFGDMIQNDVAYQYFYLYNTVVGTGKSFTYTAFASKWPHE
jgi:hypothetical protein